MWKFKWIGWRCFEPPWLTSPSGLPLENGPAPSGFSQSVAVEGLFWPSHGTGSVETSGSEGRTMCLHTFDRWRQWGWSSAMKGISICLSMHCLGLSTFNPPKKPTRRHSRSLHASTADFGRGKTRHAHVDPGVGWHDESSQSTGAPMEGVALWPIRP